MAQAQTIKFGKSMILLGGVLSTDTYAAPCGFEELTLTINIETSNVNIPDCEDPDLASWLATDIVSKQMVLAGNGILDKNAMQVWQDWWLDDVPAQERYVRFLRDIPGAEGGGYFQAPAVLTAYEETGQRGQRWRNSASITLNGKPAFTASA